MILSFCHFFIHSILFMETLDIKGLQHVLQRDGFVVFDIDKDRNELTETASLFGEVIPGDKGVLVQPLLAQDVKGGSYGSFTYVVGYDAFPWHTDTAYWDVPARYLLLTSDKPSPCATVARSFESLNCCVQDFDYLTKRAVFMLNIPGRRRLLSPLLIGRSFIGYRLDYHIFKPMNSEAKTLLASIKEQLDKEYVRIEWTGKNVAIIDNWRMIHAREDAHQDKNRSLKRIYINELV